MQRSFVWFTAVGNRSTFPAQQRLFTGALFPEGVNEELRAFAIRHHAHSNVWVPVQAVKDLLKPYGIYILPSAALCDVSLTAGNNTQDYTQLAALLADRVLVNADHTSNPQLLEAFKELVVPAVRADDKNQSRTARSAGHELTDAHPQRMPRFQHPLTVDGAPILHRTRYMALRAEQARKHYRSNYWFRHVDQNRVTYHHAEETARPGVFNPTWCVNYIPYTITGQRFPKTIARLMQQRAVECGYVSRLWMTLATAERCFGARLSNARHADAPAVHSTYFTAGMACCTYYCADQFVSSVDTTADDGSTKTTLERIIAPRLRDVELASAGVAMPLETLRAFPLLRHLAEPAGVAPHGPASGDVVRQHPSHWVRHGADASMSDAERHTRFLRVSQRYDPIQLLGDAYLSHHANTAHRLEVSGLQKALQRQCVLRGFTTPYFVSARSLCEYGLKVLCDEEGYVETLPVQLNGTPAHLDCECWFNVSQLQEPEIVLRLFLERPVHFLTRTSVSKAQALLCVRLQHHLAGDHDGCPEWVPQFVIKQTGWPLRPTARGVPVVSSSSSLSSSRGGSSTESQSWQSSAESGAWFSVSDIDLPEHDKTWLRRYCPMNRHGELFLRGLRMVLTLRAFERGYQSPIWVCLEEEEALAVHGDSAIPGPPLAAPLTLDLRDVAAEALPGRAVATEGALEPAPLVKWSDLHWVNAEELLSPPPLPDAALTQSTNMHGAAAVGRGVSAETHTLSRLRRLGHLGLPQEKGPDMTEDDKGWQ